MKLRNIFTSCCGKVDIKTRNNPAMDVWSITRGLNITVDVKVNYFNKNILIMFNLCCLFYSI